MQYYCSIKKLLLLGSCGLIGRLLYGFFPAFGFGWSTFSYSFFSAPTSLKMPSSFTSAFLILEANSFVGLNLTLMSIIWSKPASSIVAAALVSNARKKVPKSHTFTR